MYNYEKYEAEIKRVLEEGLDGCGYIRMEGENLMPCHYHRKDCENCRFKEYVKNFDCATAFLKWCLDYSEETEKEKENVDWTKVSEDTPVIVSHDRKEWHRRYFSHYDVDRKLVYTYEDGKTSWSCYDMEHQHYNAWTNGWKYGRLYEPVKAETEKTNFDKKRKECLEALQSIYNGADGMRVQNGIPDTCLTSYFCSFPHQCKGMCDFSCGKGKCLEKTLVWGMSPYEPDKDLANLPKGTLILVSNNGEKWETAYLHHFNASIKKPFVYWDYMDNASYVGAESTKIFELGKVMKE